MPEQLDETMYRILRAQQENLARLDTDLVLTRTTGTQSDISLWGPKPTLIRLYDRPLRFVQSGLLENWERIITILPVTSDPSQRIVGRADRTVSYQIQCLVQLLPAEIQRDREQFVSGPRIVVGDNPLAEKVHRLQYDLHHLFFNNIHLASEECPQGLVDDADYSLAWDLNTEYPLAFFVMTVTAERSGW